MIALIGMTIERNATSISTNDSPRTNAKIRGVASRVDPDDVHGRRGLAARRTSRCRSSPSGPEDLRPNLVPDLADDVAIDLVVAAAGHRIEIKLRRCRSPSAARVGGPLSPADPAKPAVLELRDRAADVGAIRLRSTTTSRRRSWPNGNFSLTSLIAAIPSIEDGRPVISVVPVRSRRTGVARAISRPR